MPPRQALRDSVARLQQERDALAERSAQVARPGPAPLPRRRRPGHPSRLAAPPAHFGYCGDWKGPASESVPPIDRDYDWATRPSRTIARRTELSAVKLHRSVRCSGGKGFGG